MNFSFFSGGVTTVIPTQNIELIDFVNIIKSNKYKKQIIQIRTCKDKDKQDLLKLKLDYCIPSGIFITRKEGILLKDKMKSPSGILSLDIDDYKGDYKQLKEVIKSDEYVYAVFDSPREKLKIFVNIPAETDNDLFWRRWVAACEFFGERWKCEFDELKDITRACFVSWDEDAYYNKQPKEFRGIANKEVFTKKIKPVDYNILTKGIEKGNRNVALFKLGSGLMHKGIEPSYIEVLLKTANKKNNPPLDDYELQQIFKNVFKYKKKKDKVNDNSDIKIDNYLDNARLFYDKQPFFYDKQKLWWLWKKDKWEITDDTEMERMLDDSLGFMGQTVNSRIRNNYLTAMKWVGRLNKPKDAPIKWIQFQDKVFSLKSGNIYQVKPNYFFCNPIPFKIGEVDSTPIMDKLFKEWVGPDYVQTLYEVIAYCCLRDYPIHLIFCLIGVGRNGKSRFLALLSKFIGNENVCSTELDNLLDSRFESFKLYKKLACTMGETNFGLLSKTSLLKRLCGQDMIGYEYKNKQPFDDYNYAKIIISSNALPSSADTSEGFYRRWLIVDFPNTFPEGKDILETVPKIEYNNLANKIINILPGLVDKAKFHNQGSVEQRQEKYIAASNPLSMFIEKHCVRGTSLYMKYSELYLNYIKYLLQNKRRKISRKEFKNVLDDEGLDVSKTTKYEGDITINGYFIDGIEMKEFEEENINNDSNDNNDSTPP